MPFPVVFTFTRNFVKGAVSHALDPSAENLSLLVILLILGRELNNKCLQQEETALGFRKD